MNILIPDSWLKEHVKTKATPRDIKKYLSLSGPSVERISMDGTDTIYDIEVTTNRVDMMSVRGIAREASVILPEFDINAELLKCPIASGKQNQKPLDLEIINNPKLVKRILAVKLTNVTIKPSPKEIARRLEQVGERPINSIVDCTNYVMYEIGHPIHAFDYDKLTTKKIVVREAKPKETLKTLDGKTHTTQGGEIVFDDGTGKIIDLPSIMGCENSAITNDTKNVLLWIECSDPMKIRQASMGLAVRSQAAVINEKQPDPELAHEALLRALYLCTENLGATQASSVVDIYPEREQTATIALTHKKIESYLGEHISSSRVTSILTKLGCTVKAKETKTIEYAVTPPTWRYHDMTIAEDVIEEVARIYGYHTIAPVLPATSAVPVSPLPIHTWEKKIKISLKGWGLTEFYSYSMISKKLLGLLPAETTTYHIVNPLVSEHEYMRPSLIPSMMEALAQNLKIYDSLSCFELSNVYTHVSHNLPKETPVLLLAKTGESFRELKGIVQAIFDQFGITFPDTEGPSKSEFFDTERSLDLDGYGSLGFIRDSYRKHFGIRNEVVIAELHFQKLVEDAKNAVRYNPIPKYPPVIEDLSFVVDTTFQIGPFMASLKTIHPLVKNIEYIDAYENTRTFRITYANPERNLISEECKPIREKIIALAENKYHISLKS